MCLLVIELGRFQEFPVLVLANREEVYSRPSTGPKLFPADSIMPGWIGGVDLVAGGTWLGVNQHGLLVAVTNRKKREPPANPPSRGLLCRKLLFGRETSSVVDAAMRELLGNEFAGCNLLIAGLDGAFVIEAGDTLKKTRLHPGLHLLANAELNDARDPRIERARYEFSLANPASGDGWFDTARHICRLTGTDTAAPICLSGTDRGTVSSIVLGLGRPLQSSHYWFAPGPPNVTAYDDYTPLVRQLFGLAAGQGETGNLNGNDNVTCESAINRPELSERPDIEPPTDSPARRAISNAMNFATGGLYVPELPAHMPYRILLRGPWQVEPLCRAERTGGFRADCSTIDSSTRQLPASCVVRLPASWQDLFGTYRGKVRFRRKFHPPSNIGSADRLTLVLDGVGGEGTVFLNGRRLGAIESETSSARFDVTGLLRTNNELQVDLEFIGTAQGAAPGGLYGPVVLEIDAG
jgi:uncharacterized protein with NRDE domain